MSDDAVYCTESDMFLSSAKQSPLVLLLTKDKKFAIIFHEIQRLNIGINIKKMLHSKPLESLRSSNNHIILFLVRWMKL